MTNNVMGVRGAEIPGEGVRGTEIPGVKVSGFNLIHYQ